MKTQLNPLFASYNNHKTLKQTSSKTNIAAPFMNITDFKHKQKLPPRTTVDDLHRSKNQLNLSASYKYLRTVNPRIKQQPVTVNENTNPNIKTSEALKREFNRLTQNSQRNYVRHVKSVSREIEKKMANELQYISKNPKSFLKISSKSKNQHSLLRNSMVKRNASKEKYPKDAPVVLQAPRSSNLNLVKKLKGFNANYEGFKQKMSKGYFI